MKIGYFIHKNWYPPAAGSGIHAYQVAANLTRRGHHLQTIFTRCDDPAVEQFSPAQLPRFLRSTDCIYIRINEAFRTGKFGLLKLLKLRRCPVIWEVNAPLEEQLQTGHTAATVARWQRQRALLARVVDACICNTPALADYARRNWRVRNCFVVPLGSDVELFTPEARRPDCYAQQADRFKVVWAGTPHYRWHGLDLLYLIARRLEISHPEIQFLAIGKRKGFDRYGAIPGNVELLDEVPYLEMPTYLASADLGLCLYDDPPAGLEFYRSPLKLFDYMSCGLPTVSTEASEISRIVRHGESGLIAQAQEDALIEAMLQVKENPDLARKLGAAGRQEVVRYYNWGRVAAETEEVIRQVA